MRKYTILLVVASLLLLAGCGSHLAQRAHQDASSAPVRADQAKAQAIVQGCMKHANFITHRGRLAFVHCLAPKDKTASVETCAQHKLGSDGFFTRGARRRLSQDLAGCLL